MQNTHKILEIEKMTKIALINFTFSTHVETKIEVAKRSQDPEHLKGKLKPERELGAEYKFSRI